MLRINQFAQISHSLQVKQFTPGQISEFFPGFSVWSGFRKIHSLFSGYRQGGRVMNFVMPGLQIEDGSKAGDSNSAAREEATAVSSFMSKLSAVVEKTQNKDDLTKSVLSNAYRSVGFGPMLSALKACAV
jgi:hypothetical protein